MKKLLAIVSLFVIVALLGCTATDAITDDIYTRGDIYIWEGGAWVALAAGGGGGSDNVTGPAVSTDHAVARWDGVGGNTLQDSGVIIDDGGNITTVGNVDGRDVSVDGAKLDLIENNADVTDAANVDGAGATMNVDFNAKGDLLTATANDTPSIQGVGADGTVLTADSTEADGIKWATPASGISGYNELDGSVVTTADALGAGDGAWIDWDLSGSLPVGTVAADILIQKLIATDDVGVRKNGSALARTTNTLKLQALTITAEVEADRILEIMSNDVSDLDTFALMGYWD